MLPHPPLCHPWLTGAGPPRSIRAYLGPAMAPYGASVDVSGVFGGTDPPASTWGFLWSINALYVKVRLN